MTLDNKSLSQKPKIKRVRVNRAKNEIKVLRTIIENPLDTQAELADKTGLHINTINGIVKKLDTKELRLEAMNQMVAEDVNTQIKALDIINDRLDKTPEAIATSDLVKISEFSFKRSQLLDGKPTDNVQSIITTVTIN